MKNTYLNDQEKIIIEEIENKIENGISKLNDFNKNQLEIIEKEKKGLLISKKEIETQIEEYKKNINTDKKDINEINKRLDKNLLIVEKYEENNKFLSNANNIINNIKNEMSLYNTKLENIENTIKDIDNKLDLSLITLSELKEQNKIAKEYISLLEEHTDKVGTYIEEINKNINDYKKSKLVDRVILIFGIISILSAVVYYGAKIL